jgi:cation diffusion facilitator family transporter
LVKEAKNTEAENKGNLIKIASITALVGNALLAVMKIIAGTFSGSLAVIGDGIDSSMDVIISIMALLVARVIVRPADATHPWGHGRAETVATAVLSFLLFFAGGQLILNAVSAIITGESREVPSKMALVVTGISILGKIVLAWTQYLFGKKAKSAMLIANGKNMVGDVVISVGVLAGLGLSLLFKLSIIDLIAAVLVGAWVIKAAIEIFLEANTELMDGGSGKESYRKVFDAVSAVPGAGNPHRARMRKIAGHWDIDIDVEVNPNLSVREAHTIATNVEQAIKANIEEVFDIMVHVEPAGEGQSKNEGFGLCEDEVQS